MVLPAPLRPLRKTILAFVDVKADIVQSAMTGRINLGNTKKLDHSPAVEAHLTEPVARH